MEKKFNRGEIVESSGIIILVTGDRSILAHHFSGVCIESTPDPLYPIGDFSTTWHLDKFNKAYDSLGDWMKSKQATPQDAASNGLIQAYDEYIKLLGDEIKELAILTCDRLWQSTRWEKGYELRERIAMIKNK